MSKLINKFLLWLYVAMLNLRQGSLGDGATKRPYQLDLACASNLTGQHQELTVELLIHFQLACVRL